MSLPIEAAGPVLPATPPDPPVKPRLRGVIHQWSALLAVAAIALLLTQADSGRARIAVLVYGIGLCGLLGTSAVYHRVTWRPAARRRMRRLDHSMIFVLVAGTYTPFALLTFTEPLGTIILAVVWGGALAGMVMAIGWPDAPKKVAAVPYVALGWVGIVGLPQMIDHAGWGAVALVALGGLLYTLGAAAYALKRPDPRPTTFGYHEVFHALVVVAALCHYVAIAIYVLD